MLRSNLSITQRVGMLHLLTESQVRELISDAMSQNMTHMLPPEVVRFGMELVKAGKIHIPES